MKKSKILVPALGILALSTAAAVSGTVAWFSASRSVDFAVSSTVINPEGALEVSLAPGNITEVNGRSVSLKEGFALRDASVDVATTIGSPVVYRAHLDGKGEHATSFDLVNNGLNEKASSTVASDDTEFEVWYAATWVATFSMPDSPSSDKFDIFFDESESEYGKENNDAVQNGYRVAMYSSQSTKATVWAPKHTTANNTFNATYIKSNTTVDISNNYALVNAGTYNAVSGTVTDSKTLDEAHEDNKYLGTIDGGDEDSLTVTFVSWFEGTDPGVITSDAFLAGAYSLATGKMSFNVLPQDAYAAA